MNNDRKATVRTGWASAWTRLALTTFVFLSITGLAVTFAPFHAAVQWGLLLHTVLGVIVVVPVAWYLWIHWRDYQRYNLSDAVLMGYVTAAALVACFVSGLVVTWQGLFGLSMSPAWQAVHLYSTYVAVAMGLLHIVFVLARSRKEKVALGALRATSASLAATTVGLVVVAVLSMLYAGVSYVDRLPDDYNFLYGEDRPFAPSLAMTATGGAYDSESLAGSATCGSAGCHTQIYEEWQSSAHRYAAMDPLFQKVQSVMAEQNGAESTRYCGGCHDPISLFSGTKNVFVDDLTGLHGYDEGISCLACHGIRETDLQGNANYVVERPPSYLWQWQTAGFGKKASDFLIRTYPDQHLELSKRMYKAPEYCAACHKQFIDAEVNRVGWVQLQNQYDNWKASHWFVDGDPTKTIECRECHMPLIESSDPARGDVTDYNRTAGDGKHRNHRFIGANSLVPEMLELEGWREQVRLTKEWLAGKTVIPEIQDKWRDGPVVEMSIEVPDQVEPGSEIPIRIVMSANKVGHDFPTGPLDIIQSWVEVQVVDDAGRTIFSSGTRDEGNFIEPGSFLFKAEPVDQYGNLIDRHNLWEMVGVRYRRALFPGYSDSVEYKVNCPSDQMAPNDDVWPESGEVVRRIEVAAAETGTYRVVAALLYRKVDQFLINFLLGEDSGLSAPVIEMHRTEATVRVGEPDAMARSEAVTLQSPGD